MPWKRKYTPYCQKLMAQCVVKRVLWTRLSMCGWSTRGMTRPMARGSYLMRVGLRRTGCWATEISGLFLSVSYQTLSPRCPRCPICWGWDRWDKSDNRDCRDRWDSLTGDTIPEYSPAVMYA